MIRPKYVIEFLSENMRKTGNPLGMGNEKINTWWKETDIKNEGEWFFFTGMLYQLTPYIETVTRWLEKVENSRLQTLLSLSRYVPVSFSVLSMITPKDSRNEADRILRSIHSLLVKSGTDVYYLPELDFYSGILLYDLGDDDGFREHARFVAEKLSKAGVERIVTPDPHTTYALRKLYPEYTGMEFEVKSYIELIGEPKSRNHEEFVIHDPCYYGRYLEISDRIREVLNSAGVNYMDVVYSKKMTNCCGGPIEALSPKISKEIAKLRLEELGNSNIITFCPICLANLRRAGGNAVDFALVVGDGDR
ncbi:heterodisulfide reductase-related iron-sulfur binding cluster [Geoglobus acetivorans]|uniref:(Fe-S)-binding protein n=1 Tax=Geoglobus acetivorans TaxID=565033 RepID=A0ABZ3H6U1_GEOAI|nr:(Fe-S)-binding protein [Geoglobus acetivorans]